MTQAELESALAASICTIDAAGRLVHPGLPAVWAIAAAILMSLVIGRSLLVFSTGQTKTLHFNLTDLPIAGNAIRYMTQRNWILVIAKVIVAALFIFLIYAGLYGSPIPERNIATVLTWNIWWTTLIISIFFIGSAWCAVCPWDTIASVIVRGRLWGRVRLGTSLNLRVPSFLRSVWPALLLLAGLTWLELGAGITASPYGTAVLALTILVLTTVSLALFERKAFCRYFCPVGRTVGAYSQLAPVELRPIDADICARCTTLECYYGTSTIEPCPTHLVMGRLNQNTYCTSCGNCAQSCPDQNVAWRLRSPSTEAMEDARPHWDEAWFMLGLLALTGFHGVVMTGLWDDFQRQFGLAIGDSGQMLWSFTCGFLAVLAVPVVLFALAVWTTWLLNNKRPSFSKTFSHFAFVALPLVFSYHIAHNLNHLVLEGRGLTAVLTNPLGVHAQPLSQIEKQVRGADLLLPLNVLNALQAAIVVVGFLVAVLIIRARTNLTRQSNRRPQALLALPFFVFATATTAYHLILMMQPMVMRY